MKNVLIFITIFLIVFFLSFLGVKVDLFFNSYLYNAAKDWQWYNYFTSHHSITMLYLLHRNAYTIFVFLIALGISLFCKDDYVINNKR